MSYLKNCWYVAAWAEEIGAGLFHRTLLGEPVLIFRRPGGSLTAMSDTCPHRFAPLHKGVLTPDGCVQCPYHGLRFDANGACVHNPHGDHQIPRAAVLKTYRVEERDRIVWIWMGDQDKADALRIPDYSFLNEQEKFEHTPGQLMTLPLRMELMLDNLMDLSHAAYLHPTTVGSEAVGRGSMKVLEIEGGLQVNNWYPNGNPPVALAATGAAPADAMVDFWNEVRWLAPGALWLDAGLTPTGHERAEGVVFSSAQFLTPESESSTHYFWQVYRSYSLGRPDITAAIVSAVQHAFQHEDEPMVAAVQSRMAGRDFWSMKPVLLQSDVAAVKARRLMDRLRSEEQSAQGETKLPTDRRTSPAV